MDYGTQAGADAYHAARGNDAWAALDDPQKAVALTRGTDYVDQRYRVQLKTGRWVSVFCGSKTDPEQFREFPRDGSDTVPEGIEYAAYEAALREAVSKGSLMPDYVATGQKGPVTEETVGPVSVKYANIMGKMEEYCMPPNLPVIPQIDTLVAPYICGPCTNAGMVTV